MQAYIKAVEYSLPVSRCTNEDLAAIFPEWSSTKIEQKLGIRERRIASPQQCSSDLAVTAAEKLFSSKVCTRDDIDYTIFCTQSPDFLLPTTACLIQDRLGLPKTSGAFDLNLGCSGWVYAVGVAKGLLETGQARNVLLLTGETYSKFLSPSDRSTRTLFGDAGAATLLSLTGTAGGNLGPFLYGTDGSGGCHLKLEVGGMRNRGGTKKPDPGLWMNGGEVFAFSLREVERVAFDLMRRANVDPNEIDVFLFHQANAYMLETLRQKCNIPNEKFYVWMKDVGNTVSNTIPIALHHGLKEGVIASGTRVMFVGFGVGLSWAACLATF